MKPAAVLVVSLFLIGLNAQAGSLMNGQWQPANCGQKPPAPTINTKSVDGYNQSVKDINAWQAKAQEYYNCIVKEANIDNQIIATTANSAQEEFRNEVSRIQKEAEAGKAKVEKN
ncbi:hypothetical protein MGMO_82c00020 [Methyloglobulus morosus KoM1]|uniref:Uncharacterized protein n=1 Tax=Methyloglobulus morosus KoM1 TaxID=1116472 RepID=V5DX99_9GAMM|nr:hypothetical protein [Methyloglobulus morosus]ESS71951.1 hypothetical protein MGMO_82c00020 [Methyloglobulus morosus KoM1]